MRPCQGIFLRALSAAGKRTEQLGRSATDCAWTSDAASEVSRRKKHFIVPDIKFGTGWIKVCTR